MHASRLLAGVLVLAACSSCLAQSDVSEIYQEAKSAQVLARLDQRIARELKQRRQAAEADARRLAAGQGVDPRAFRFVVSHGARGEYAHFNGYFLISGSKVCAYTEPKVDHYESGQDCRGCGQIHIHASPSSLDCVSRGRGAGHPKR